MMWISEAEKTQFMYYFIIIVAAVLWLRVWHLRGWIQSKVYIIGKINKATLSLFLEFPDLQNGVHNRTYPPGFHEAHISLPINDLLQSSVNKY